MPVTVVQAGPVPRRPEEDRRQGRLRRRPDRPRRRAAGPPRQQGGAGATSRRPASRRCGRSWKCEADKGDELKPGDKVLCDIVRREGPRRRHRHLQGQGLPGRHRAPRLPRRRARRTARCSTARRARSARRPSRRASIPARAPRAGWAAGSRRPRTSSSCASTPRRTSSTSRGAVPGARNSIVKIVRSSFAQEEGVRRMAKIPVMELEEGAGRARSTCPPDVFAYPYRKHLVWEVVKAYLAGQRAGTHKTKVRSEVSGSGKKPFKQKGTGRARQGGGRPPIHRHGGTVHGPVPRSLRAGRVRRREEERAQGGPLAPRRGRADRRHRQARRREHQDEGPRHGASARSASRARRSSSTPAATTNFVAGLAQRQGVEARRPARRQRLRRPRSRHARAHQAGALARGREPGRRVMDAQQDHPPAPHHREGRRG